MADSQVGALALFGARENTARPGPGPPGQQQVLQRLRVGRLGLWAVLTTRGCACPGCPLAAVGVEAGPHRGRGARLRLYIADHEPTASWISERVIRQRWAGTGARIADDALAFRDGGQDGIELELHSKVAHRSQATIADVDPAWSAGV